VGDRPVDHEDAVAFFKESYASHLLDTTRPYPGIVDLLDRLDGVRMALLTNKAHAMSKTITDELGLSKYFEVFVGGDTLPKRKPDPGGLYFILEKTGVPKGRALLIGDGRNDLLTAVHAGVRSVWVSWGFSDWADIEGLQPDFIVHNTEELLGLVRMC
jgi:phosphoglycolate phosphatase